MEIEVSVRGVIHLLHVSIVSIKRMFKHICFMHCLVFSSALLCFVVFCCGLPCRVVCSVLQYLNGWISTILKFEWCLITFHLSLV